MSVVVLVEPHYDLAKGDVLYVQRTGWNGLELVCSIDPEGTDLRMVPPHKVALKEEEKEL